MASRIRQWEMVARFRQRGGYGENMESPRNSAVAGRGEDMECSQLGNIVSGCHCGHVGVGLVNMCVLGVVQLGN